MASATLMEEGAVSGLALPDRVVASATLVMMCCADGSVSDHGNVGAQYFYKVCVGSTPPSSIQNPCGPYVAAEN